MASWLLQVLVSSTTFPCALSHHRRLASSTTYAYPLLNPGSAASVETRRRLNLKFASIAMNRAYRNLDLLSFYTVA